MPDSFNPYLEWLGVQSAASKPNHYELLGLTPYESKPEAITAAASTQMAKVRSVRPGGHIDQWRQLLDELETAKRCLIDSAEKSNYDARLRERGWPSANPAILKRSVAKPGSNAAIDAVPSGASAASPTSTAKAGKENWQPGTNLLPPSRRAAAAKSQPRESVAPASESSLPATAPEKAAAKQPAAPRTPVTKAPAASIQLPRPFPLLPMPGAQPSTTKPTDVRAAGALPANLLPSAMQMSPVAGTSSPAAFPQSPVLPRPTSAEPIYPQPAHPHPQATPSERFFEDVLKENTETARSPLERLGISEPTSPSSAADATGSTATDESGDFEPESSRRRTRATRKKGSKTALLVGGVVVLIGGAAAVAMILVARSRPESAVASAQNSTAPNAELGQSGPARSNHSATAGRLVGGPTARLAKQIPLDETTRANQLTTGQNQPRSVNTPPSQQPYARSSNPLGGTSATKTVIADPVKTARLNHLLVDVHHKLAERDQAEAHQLIAEAKTLAVTPEQVDRVARLGTLVKYVGEFWTAARNALAALKVADEIDVGSTKVIVVESDKQSLTIHMGSGNHHFEFKELPSGLAIALASRWLDPNKPANKVFIGAFCAVDPKLPDGPGDARRLWSEAAAAGVPDGPYLLPLLNEPSAEAENDDALPPVPRAEAVEQVTQKIKGEFASAIAAATTSRQVDSLVRRLFNSEDSSVEPVRRYALCVLARDFAAKAGRATQTIDAIDRIARDFHIDSLDMKADTFAGNPPTTEMAGKEMARAALKLIDEAVAANRIALATRFAQTATSAANISKSRDLIRRAKQRSAEIEALGGKKMAADPR